MFDTDDRFKIETFSLIVPDVVTINETIRA